ncbi:MAG: hypothetical protein P1U80_11945 [Pseudomonadales bacterium]|nr:hypothetical protein [Pseudomonadales bacterium]
MTTIETARSQFLQAQDNFNRLLAQTKALAVVLMPEDESSTYSVEITANAIWLLTDRLKDIESAFEDTIKLVEDNSLVGRVKVEG